MGIFDTPKQADALCTVIALGFIISSKDELKNHSYIIYQEGTQNDAEHRRYLQLQAKLAKLKIPLSFKTQDAAEKSSQPVILGQTDYSVLQGDVLGKIRDLLNRLETEVNEQKKIPLRGAYIGGGFFADGKAELLEPSILYCYAPEYRTVSQEVEDSYQNAKRVTEAVQTFLEKEFSEGSRMKKDGSILYRASLRPLSTPMPDSTQKTSLFGSIHGMTQSMIHYISNADTSKVSMELALSADTCKVASCIPCSIFMWANGKPATATHFGRGDNWNFPSLAFQKLRMCSGPDGLTPLAGYPYVKNWIEHVWKAYDAGNACFAGKPESWFSEDLAFALHLGREKIPQMFLEALTFEGSFLDKMLSTLKNVPEESLQL